MLACNLIPEPHHRVERIQVHNALGKPLRLVLFLPAPPVYEPAPAVIVCQPMNNPPGFSRPLALELVRDGFAVLTFDWSGECPDEDRQLLRSHVQETLAADAAAAFAYLCSRPDVDAGRIAATGHSVGANLAVDLALDRPVSAVACIGMAREVEGAMPRNLLWTAGLYDEFWSPASMAAAFEDNVGEKPQSLAYTDASIAGTTRGLALSPTADHFTELLDWRMHRIVANWFRARAGIGEARRAYCVGIRNQVRTLAWVFALVAGLLSAHSLARWRPGLFRSVPAAALLAVVVFDFALGSQASRLTDIVLYLIVLAPLAGFLYRSEPEELEKELRQILRFGFVLWMSLMLTLLLNTLPAIARAPKLALFFPEFALRYPLDMLFAYLLLYSRQLLLSSYASEGLAVRLWVYALLCVEAVAPGLLLRLVASAMKRRPSSSKRDAKIPVTHVLAFGALLVALAVIVWFRIGQGFVTAESMQAAARFMFRFGLIPVGVFMVLWRLSARVWPPSIAR